MARDLLHEALRGAAAPTLERIRQDRERVPHQLSKFLDYIAEHLLDPELNVSRVKQATGVRSHSLPKLFRAHTETSPRAYIEIARLEIADRLVRRSDLEMGQIAMAVGFTSYGTFSRAYKAWAGESPSKVRSKSNVPGIGYPTWRQAMRRELEPETAGEVMGHLAGLFSEFKQQIGDGEPVDRPRIVVDGEQYIRIRAQEVWQEVRDLAPDEQKRCVGRYEFRSSALFDLLREKSRFEGRRDRQRGVELAKLALVSLEGSAEFFGERIHDLRALGLAWLGNALRLGHDFVSANRMLEKANAEWQAPRREKDFLVLAKIRDREVALRICQRNYDEAQKLVDEARDLYKLIGNVRGEAKALLELSAIQHYTDRPSDCIATLQAATSLVEDIEDPYLAYVLHGSLAIVLGKEGRYSLAIDNLERAKGYCERLEYQWGLLRIQWTEALIQQGLGRLSVAENLLVAARSGFIAAKEPTSLSFISLDLALFYAEQDRWSAVLDLLGEIIPVLGTLRLYEETLSAIGLLAKAVEAGNVSSALLLSVQEELQLDPLTRLFA